ncbi:dUTP diphosphatase [Streptomyces sp. B6B3]|uniref:dUTP diphosphatase n=1 Tax=Streptomyces sp. B6B3 TaxID=3153570 RepID=UPI00325D4C62
MTSDPTPAGEPATRAPLDVMIRRTDPAVPVPSRAHPGDAGVDLVTTEAVELDPGERAVLPTGVSIALPEGYAAFVHPRSGLAARCGVSMVNAPGTIDAGYRGEIKVIVINLDPRRSVRFEPLDRIAQLVVQRVETVRFHEVAELPDSVRATGGFGSTGGHAGGHNPYAAVGSGASADRIADRKGL